MDFLRAGLTTHVNTPYLHSDLVRKSSISAKRPRDNAVSAGPVRQQKKKNTQPPHSSASPVPLVLAIRQMLRAEYGSERHHPTKIEFCRSLDQGLRFALEDGRQAARTPAHDKEEKKTDEKNDLAFKHCNATASTRADREDEKTPELERSSRLFRFTWVTNLLKTSPTPSRFGSVVIFTPPSGPSPIRVRRDNPPTSTAGSGGARTVP